MEKQCRKALNYTLALAASDSSAEAANAYNSHSNLWCHICYCLDWLIDLLTFLVELDSIELQSIFGIDWCPRRTNSRLNSVSATAENSVYRVELHQLVGFAALSLLVLSSIHWEWKISTHWWFLSLTLVAADPACSSSGSGRFAQISWSGRSETSSSPGFCARSDPWSWTLLKPHCQTAGFDADSISGSSQAEWPCQ